MRIWLQRNLRVILGTVCAVAIAASFSHAGDHDRQAGTPKRGPNSVWRLVQQPTSLGIGSCAQSIIESRAAGMRPMWIPYHGWKERHAGKVGYRPSQWSPLGGINFQDCQVSEGAGYGGMIMGAQGCPTCQTRFETSPEVVELPRPPIASESADETASDVKQISYSSKASAKNQVPAIPVPGLPAGSEMPIGDVAVPYSPAVIDGSAVTVYPSTSLGPVTAMAPGTAQLFIDCPPEMKLTLFTSRKEANGKTLLSSGARRLVECTGLGAEGTFGYLLTGSVGNQKYTVEHVTTYDSYPAVPRVFQPVEAAKGGKVWVGVKSGDRVHIRFAKRTSASKKTNPSALAEPSPRYAGLFGSAALMQPEPSDSTASPDTPPAGDTPPTGDTPPVAETPPTAGTETLATQPEPEPGPKYSFSYGWQPFRSQGETHRLYAQTKYDYDSKPGLIKEFNLLPEKLTNRPSHETPKTLVLVAKGLTKDAKLPATATLMAQLKYRTKNDGAMREGPKLDAFGPVQFPALTAAEGETTVAIGLNHEKLLPQWQNKLQRFEAINSNDPLEYLEFQYYLILDNEEAVNIGPAISIQILP